MDAGNTTPQDDSQRRTTLHELCERLLALYQETGDQAALEVAVGYMQDAVDLTPPGHDDRAALLSNLAILLWEGFTLTLDLYTLERAVVAAREAVAVTTPGQSERLSRLSNLADYLGAQYVLTGELSALGEAIDFTRQALELAPVGHSDRPALLNNLANHLHRWYALTGKRKSLTEAIRLTQEAVNLTSPGHPDLASRLNNLGTHFRALYALTGRRTLLAKAVRCAREAVRLTPPEHPDRAAWLNSLGNQLSDWYTLTGDRKTLEQALRSAREAVELTPPGHGDRPDWLNNLGSHLSVWYGLTGDRTALEEAIQCACEAVKTAPVGYSDRPGFLNNLASHLSDWYALTGQAEALDEAIEIAREAVKPEMTPFGHTDRPSRLNNLANHLSEKYFLTGDGEILDEAVRCAREAVMRTPSGHALLPGYLINLGNRLSDWSMFTGTQDALAEAVGCARRALRMLKPGHSQRAVVLNNLSNYLSAQYVLTQDGTALDEAIDCSRAAVAVHAATPDEIPPTRLRGHYMSLAEHLMDRAGNQDWEEAYETLTLALRQQSHELGRQKGERSGMDYLRGKDEIYGMAVRCCLELARRRECEGRPAEARALREQAWSIAEHGKGRLFAAMLAAERQALAGAGNPRIRELLTQIDNLRRELAVLESARLWREDKRPGSAARQERTRRIKEIWRHTEEFVAELRLLDPELASLTAAQPQPLERIRAALDPQALLLEFYPRADELVIFAVNRQELRVASEPVSLAQLTEWTHQLDRCVHPEQHPRSATGDVAGFQRLMAEMGSILTPVLQELLGQACPVPPTEAARELICVPTGPLHRWPLHLLPWGEGILWDAWSVSYVPTADTLYYCAQRRPEGEDRPLLLAPDPGLVGSFGEALLAEACGWRVAVKEAATLQAVAGSQGSLALVTHVEARPQQGASSAIRLWVGDCLGWITAIEMLQFIATRRPAEHGELATCGAHYEESREGDHLQGLTRSFLKAHLRSLTTTLWRVDDMASCYLGARCRDLMAKGGQSKAACLRQAALELRDYGWGGVAEWLVSTAPRARRGQHLLLSLAAQYRRMVGDLTGARALWEQVQGTQADEGPYEAAFAPLRQNLGQWVNLAHEILQSTGNAADIFAVTPLTPLHWGPFVLIGDSRLAAQ